MRGSRRRGPRRRRSSWSTTRARSATRRRRSWRRTATASRATYDAGLAIGVDDAEPHFRYANEHAGPAQWPFDEPFYVMLNLAVGGNWGGKHGVADDALENAVFEVAHVRVYRR